ncbi:MAG: 3-deoxy-7-phosphoheptulonate synthase [Candidatus Melainabacteria bacterium]|nr:3-deoxy-7-phosphoheptulonate synthase [Candidatus Melainabacteria bacterium]
MDVLLTEKRSPDHRTEICIAPGVVCGGKQLLLIGGPCAVESAEQMEECGAVLSRTPVQALRGGVFKPRTSPYSFQGLGNDGVSILCDAGKRHGLPVVSEVMSAEQLSIAVDNFDVLQVGSRNMQNFELLKAVGKLQKPILLKRGLAATIEEFLMAAEYIISGGNPNVILCERGIRSFDSNTRNVLDLGAVVTLKKMTHLPIIVDPSHAAGRSDLVADLARAAVACGADGVMIECHPQPLKSISDAQQALSLSEMKELVQSLADIAKVVGREVATAGETTPRQNVRT